MSESLYDKIGGEEAIAELVEYFYEKVLADPELKFYFEHVPVDKLQRMQREFFSAATGGPILYSGRPLSEVHHRLDISRREFQRFCGHLVATLDGLGVAQSDVAAIIAHVNIYADEIVNDVEP